MPFLWWQPSPLAAFEPFSALALRAHLRQSSFLDFLEAPSVFLDFLDFFFFFFSGSDSESESEAEEDSLSSSSSDSTALRL